MVEATPTPEVSPGGHSTFLFRAWPGAQRAAKAIRANWVGSDAARGGGYWLLDVDVGVGVVVRCVWLIVWARGVQSSFVVVAVSVGKPSAALGWRPSV